MSRRSDPMLSAVVRRLSFALGSPLSGNEVIDGRVHRVWRWQCPCCGDDTPAVYALLLSDDGWFQCQAHGCAPEMISAAVELRELPVRVAA